MTQFQGLMVGQAGASLLVLLSCPHGFCTGCVSFCLGFPAPLLKGLRLNAGWWPVLRPSRALLPVQVPAKRCSTVTASGDTPGAALPAGTVAAGMLLCEEVAEGGTAGLCNTQMRYSIQALHEL